MSISKELPGGEPQVMRDLPLLGFKHPPQNKDILDNWMEAIRRTVQPLTVPLVLVNAVIFGIAGGLLATKLSLGIVLLLLAGFLIFLLVFSMPELVILAILALTSTILSPEYFEDLRGGFAPAQLLVMLIMGMIFARVLSKKENVAFVRTPLDWPILLFFVATIISFFYAKYILGSVNIFRNNITLKLITYLLFFAVTNLVRTRQQLMRLIGGMFVMATIVAAFMVIQQAVGPGVTIIPGQASVRDATVLGKDLTGVARITVDGSSIVYVMLLPALILHVTPEHLKSRKWLTLIPVILFPMAIAFTFTRSMWAGALLASLIFIFISRLDGKRFVLLILALAIAAMLLIPLANAFFPRTGTIVDGLTARFTSIFAGKELVNDNSTQWRIDENRLAMAKFAQHPILGIGPRADYRAPWYKEDIFTGYVHNAYIFLLLDFGLVGFIPLLWFSVIFLLRGFTYWKTLEDPILRSIVIGFTLSFIAIFYSNFTSPRLLEAEYIPLIAVIMGVNEVAIRLGQRTSQ